MSIDNVGMVVSIDLFHARIYGNEDDVTVGGVYVSHASWWDKSLGRR